MHQKQNGKGQNRELMRALGEWGVRHRAPSGGDLLVALDDTDNLESPGTGFRARELAVLLAKAGLGRPMGITRHQLLVDPAIPYTSHNSAACVVLTEAPGIDAAFDLACHYLRDAAAEGSDVGLVVVRRRDVPDTLRDWGRSAKARVLTLDDARTLAEVLAGEHPLRHAELSGTGCGLIGALAAVGLNSGGNDGRLLWLRGLRESAGQIVSPHSLAATLGTVAQTPDGAPVDGADTLINLGDWPRAIQRDHRPVLLVEPCDDPHRSFGWTAVDRDTVKRYSA